MNRARACAIMERHGLDALVATTTENFAYLTRMQEVERLRQNWLARYWAVLPRRPDAPVGMLVPRIHLQFPAQIPLAVDVIRSYGEYGYAEPGRGALSESEERLVELRRATNYSDPFHALRALIDDLGVVSRVRLGVDERMLSHVDRQKLAAEFPSAEIVDAHDFFREIRMIKTADEIDLMRTALRITVEAMADAIRAIRIGRPQRDAHEALRMSMYAKGLHPRNITVGIGRDSIWAFAQPSDRLTAHGDIIKFDFGGVYEGYWTDWGRTGTVGKPDDILRRRYNALREGQQAGCAALRPGVIAGDVFNIIQETVRRCGIPDYERSAYGHGIGREIYDFPSISAGVSTSFEPGMVVNVETPFYELGYGGLQIEDTLVITETGSEYLVDADRELFMVE